ncbi:MAG: BON domain-containing protein [Ketobacteraceae bacterium]|nr:BON domain-containing protein [Ketobacteraceae bacterium]
MSKHLPRHCIKGLLLSFALMTPPVSDAVEQRGVHDSEPPDNRLMQLVEESWRKGTIDAAFLLNKNLESGSIEVTVKETTAILRGTVDSPVKRSLAAEIARSVEGIQTVANQIVVKTSPYSKPASSTALKPNYQDTLLTARVNQKLLSNKYLRTAAIDVHTQDGVVELSGNIPEDSLRDLAYYLVKNVQGVKSVDNKIKVRLVQ